MALGRRSRVRAFPLNRELVRLLSSFLECVLRLNVRITGDAVFSQGPRYSTNNQTLRVSTRFVECLPANNSLSNYSSKATPFDPSSGLIKLTYALSFLGAVSVLLRLLCLSLWARFSLILFILFFSFVRIEGNYFPSAFFCAHYYALTSFLWCRKRQRPLHAAVCSAIGSISRACNHDELLWDYRVFRRKDWVQRSDRYRRTVKRVVIVFIMRQSITIPSPHIPLMHRLAVLCAQ